MTPLVIVEGSEAAGSPTLRRRTTSSGASRQEAYDHQDRPSYVNLETALKDAASGGSISLGGGLVLSDFYSDESNKSGHFFYFVVSQSSSGSGSSRFSSFFSRSGRSGDSASQAGSAPLTEGQWLGQDGSYATTYLDPRYGGYPGYAGYNASYATGTSAMTDVSPVDVSYQPPQGSASQHGPVSPESQQPPWTQYGWPSNGTGYSDPR